AILLRHGIPGVRNEDFALAKIMLLHPSPRWLQHEPERCRPFVRHADCVGMATKSAPLYRSKQRLAMRRDRKELKKW
ncbi:hypothetical protein AB9F39_36515, partial [Rhizobium leguminosarum]|uniref:hypothetical protein n=1 Tax=Rhizobium leguminosarum TaxID=384 RepID=UPI003F9C3E6B